ncbi:MAG TPA: glutamate formimidoyltransferase [Elusimicrobiales bacterium]|nr:glutamate formimidoyltransferase [Elusimicrobiales bacterium]HPO94870.1 glutamate formimidoyltransferase [Elusimicrobiales bacterium]
MKFVECVPNFSEGKDKNKINDIVNAAKSVSGVSILDVESDSDHNRTVLTFIAPLDKAVEAMFRVAKRSAELIDLNYHKGEHPRMGALDVAPFIPIMDTSIDECVALAKELGRRIGEELSIPVYLYDQAAQREDRKDLAKVRKGQFEGLKDEIGKNPDRVPDFGPNKIHPTAGAVAVGARFQIINFNVNLDTTDMDFAKALAKKIRTSGGGLPALRAKEIFLESKNQVQISTVLTNYGVTSIKKVLDEIKKEIEPKGIKITDTELIGLTAQKPLVDYSIESLKVSNFNYENQVLENKIAKLLSGWEMGANFVVDALSNTNPTPGGGSAAAICGSMGAALIEMALGITVKAKKTPEDLKNKLNGYLLKIKNMRSELQSQMSEDAASFDTVMAAFKLPKEDPNRKSEIQKALVYAANIPLKTARICAEISSVAREVLEVEVKQDVISDYRSGLYMLECGVKCALENVYINAKSIEDETVKKNLLSEAENLVKAVSLK